MQCAGLDIPHVIVAGVNVTIPFVLTTKPELVETRRSGFLSDFKDFLSHFPA